MNKKYNKKVKRIINTFKLIGILIFVLGILISIVEYTINKSKSESKENNASNYDNLYKITGLDNNVVYQNNIKITLAIDKFDNESIYKVHVKIKEENTDYEKDIEQEKTEIQINFNFEGIKNVEFIIYKDNMNVYDETYNVYYIEKYQKQYLDEKDTNSVQVHYIDGTWEKYDKSINLINECGFKNIKSSFLWNSIEKKYGVYDFSYYDEWMQKSKELGMNVFACVNRVREWRRK